MLLGLIGHSLVLFPPIDDAGHGARAHILTRNLVGLLADLIPIVLELLHSLEELQGESLLRRLVLVRLLEARSTLLAA